MPKRESRILGISATPRNGGRVALIGLVYRGMSWLDGVILHIMTLSEASCLSDLATNLRTSKQYSQIQTAIFSRENILPNGLDDVRRLSDLIEFPILVICREFNESRNSLKLKWREKGKTEATFLWASNGRTEVGEEIYRIGCKRGCHVPEAVRVADIIATQLCFDDQHQVTLKSHSH